MMTPLFFSKRNAENTYMLVKIYRKHHKGCLLTVEIWIQKGEEGVKREALLEPANTHTEFPSQRQVSLGLTDGSWLFLVERMMVSLQVKADKGARE